jgi:hypothetical protein
MSGHTPGPWSWFGNARNHEIYLATKHSGRHYVMGFRRWGMSGAQPMFQPADRGLVPAERLLTFEVGDRDVRGVEQAKANDSVYRLDISGIDCADARLIAAAPCLATNGKAVADWLQACLECADYKWDADQRECAELALAKMRAALARVDAL